MKNNKSYHKASKKPYRGNYRVFKNRSGNAKKSNLLAKIQQGYRDRSRKDIKAWRDALALAESKEEQNLQPLIDLYEELLLDAHLHAQIQLREESTLSRNFFLSKDGEKEEEATKVFKQPATRQFIKLAMEAIFKGDTLMELEEVTDKMISNFLYIPRENVDTAKKKVYLNPDKSKFIQYDSEGYKPWVIEITSPVTLGLLNKVAPYVIWKRNAMQAWAEYTDIFGIPFRHATTNAKNQKELDQIETMLREMGSASYGLFPLGTEVKIEGSQQPDAYKVFDMMVQRANSEISKAINSVTMLSDNGSSKSQSEVHERMQERLRNSDGQFIKEVINYKLLPLMAMHNILPEGLEFDWDNTQALTKEKQWEIVKELLNTHEIPSEWIS
uniref:phage portal protein family protein n=1 Tax=Flammeovirga sp. OC4 TaxID=1382345 RepID=UPI0005C707AA